MPEKKNFQNLKKKILVSLGNRTRTLSNQKIKKHVSAYFLSRLCLWKNFFNISYRLASVHGCQKMEKSPPVNICKFSAKFIHENLPSTFSTVFKKLNSTRTYKMLIDIPKSKSLELFPAVYYPKIWNQQSIKLRSSKSVTIVKNLFKSTSVTNYKRFRCNKQTRTKESQPQMRHAAMPHRISI